MSATHMRAIYMCAIYMCVSHAQATLMCASHMYATHMRASHMYATHMHATLICFFVAMIKHMTQTKCGEERIHLSCRLQLITEENQSRNPKGGTKMEVTEEFLLTTSLPMAGSACLPI